MPSGLRSPSSRFGQAPRQLAEQSDKSRRVVDAEQQRKEDEAGSGHRPLEHGHLEKQSLHASRRLRSALERDIRTERHTAHDGSGEAEVVEQTPRRNPRTSPSCASRRGAACPTSRVPEGRARTTRLPARARDVASGRLRLRVEEKPVEVDENLRSRAVHLV